MSAPNWEFETKFQSFGLVAGVDEVGRGCLAGPVVAAAAILDLHHIPKGIDDSKKLSAVKREALDKLIRESALSVSIGVGTVEEIDTINILMASKLAMVRAVDGLSPAPSFLLVDGNFKIDHKLRQACLVKGDQRSLSIAAASIVAKVYRDKLMQQHAESYPGYDFKSNKGYGSRKHRLGLSKQGPTPIHRKTFKWTPVTA